MAILVYQVNGCDLQSPIERIQANFDSNDYAKVLSLVVVKYVEPTKKQNSVFRSGFGPEYTKIKNFLEIHQPKLWQDRIKGTFISI